MKGLRSHRVLASSMPRCISAHTLAVHNIATVTASTPSMTSDSYIRHPAYMQYTQREADKLDFRFPGEGGESYMDVIQRVRPIIVELERQPRRCDMQCLHAYRHVRMLLCIYRST